MTAWSLDHARRTYSIPHWSEGYFDVDALGRISVAPRGPQGTHAGCLTVQHRQVGPPRPHRLAVLFRQDSGCLRQMSQVVDYPGCQQLTKRDGAQ